MAKVLIVDDSIIMRRNLKVILSQAGHQVIAEASNGKEAFIEYEKHLPDLVTMDITMPIMNGIDSVKKIIGSYPKANIIMISALDQKNMVFDALENGAMHYIIKPITAEKVLAVVEAVLKDVYLLDEAAAAECSSSRLCENDPQEESLYDLSEIPFSIENKNGTFIISVASAISVESFTALDRAIQGFLFIKPLSIVFNFNQVQRLDAALLAQFRDSIERLKEAGGSLGVYAENQELAQQIKESCSGVCIVERLV